MEKTNKLTIRYLSALREIANIREQRINLQAEQTLEDVLNMIKEQHGIEYLDPRIMVVLNGKGWKQHPEGFKTKVRSGDVLMLTPVLEGG